MNFTLWTSKSSQSVQLKGNLTHTDGAHTTYWLKACSLSSSINVYGKENLPKLILKGKNVGKKALIRYSCQYILVPFIVYVYTYVHSYLDSIFSSPTLCATASLYYHASLRHWYNKKSSFLEECYWLFGSQIMKHTTLTNNSEPILANISSYLPTNWLNKLEDINRLSIINEESILYIHHIYSPHPAKQ